MKKEGDKMIEEILIANPPKYAKRKGGKKMTSRRRSIAAKKGWRNRKRSKGRVSRRRNVRPRRYRYRRSNPGFGNLAPRRIWSGMPTGFRSLTKNIAGGAVGGIAANKLPELFGVRKYSVADIGISAGSTVIGGVILNKYVNRDVAMGYATVGGLVTAVKFIRMILGGRVNFLGGEDDLDQMIFGVGDSELYEDELDEEMMDILDEEDSLVGDEEVIIPTAFTGLDDY